jgi:hypothetical protein
MGLIMNSEDSIVKGRDNKYCVMYVYIVNGRDNLDKRMRGILNV